MAVSVWMGEKWFVRYEGLIMGPSLARQAGMTMLRMLDALDGCAVIATGLGGFSKIQKHRQYLFGVLSSGKCQRQNSIKSKPEAQAKGRVGVDGEKWLVRCEGLMKGRVGVVGGKMVCSV